MKTQYQACLTLGVALLLAVLITPLRAHAQTRPGAPSPVHTTDTNLPRTGHTLADSVLHPFNDSIFAAVPGLPSPSTASRISLIATAVPIGIGLAMIALDDPEIIREDTSSVTSDKNK